MKEITLRSHLTKIGKLGRKARWKKKTKKQRSDYMRALARKRWGLDKKEKALSP